MNYKSFRQWELIAKCAEGKWGTPGETQVFYVGATSLNGALLQAPDLPNGWYWYNARECLA